MAKSKAVAIQNDNKQVAQQGARNAYQEFSDEVRQSGIEGDLLRFNKQGEWIAGQEGDELEEGTELIMGLNTLRRGWQKWEDGKPVDSRMGLVSEGYRPVDREELDAKDEDEWEEDDDDKKRDPWQKTMVCLLKNPTTGDVYTYATSSKSGIASLGEAGGIYGDRLQDGQDPEAMPIVKLMNSWYKHKKYGKIFTPVFEFTDTWVTPSDVPEPKAKASAKKTAAKPAAKGKDKPKSNAGAANGKTAPKGLPAPRKPAQTGGRARI